MRKIDYLTLAHAIKTQRIALRQNTDIDAQTLAIADNALRAVAIAFADRASVDRAAFLEECRIRE